jgi:ArsR family transcriptional regulator, arsenate/arsenite/antimonite-responsive transcriptional repressor / arsenate reductase (thioredoxin)
VSSGDHRSSSPCATAHEELDANPRWLHWSVPAPVATPTKAAFDAAVAELRDRITSLVETGS